MGRGGIHRKRHGQKIYIYGLEACYEKLPIADITERIRIGALNRKEQDNAKGQTGA